MYYRVFLEIAFSHCIRSACFNTRYARPRLSMWVIILFTPKRRDVDASADANAKAGSGSATHDQIQIQRHKQSEDTAHTTRQRQERERERKRNRARKRERLFVHCVQKFIEEQKKKIAHVHHTHTHIHSPECTAIKSLN